MTSATPDAYVTCGWGFAAIAHRLNERAVPPPTSLRRGGVPAWTKSTIWAILRNAVYRGTLVYAKTGYAEIGKRHGKVTRAEKDRIIVEQAFPEIVPRELWEAAQAKRTTQRYGVGRPWHRPYLLSSMIACGHCGKKFQAHQPTRRLENPYYVCGGYIASGLSICDGLRVPMSYLDEAVLDGIQKRLDRVLDRDVLRQRLRQLLETDRPREGAIEALDARLTEVRRRIARLVDVAAAGSEDLPSVRSALVGLERERSALEAELAETRARAGAPERSDAVAEALIESLSRSREILEAGDPEERRRLVRAFLRGVEIRKTTRQAILSWYRLLNPVQLSVN